MPEANSVEPVGSAMLEADHWAHAAIQRLEAWGAVPVIYARGAPSLGQAEALRLLRAAAAAAEDPVVARAAHAYAERLQEEIVPAIGGAADSFDPVFGHRSIGWIGLEFGDRRGDVLAGIGYDNATDWTGARPVPGERGGRAELGWSAVPHRAVALEATMSVDGEGAALRSGQVTFVGRGVGVWAGRRTVGYATGSSGGIVLSPATFDAVGLFLASPLELPGILRHLGPIRFETFLTRIENGDRIANPWFWAMRGVLSPHPRVRLGATRGIQFGGEGNSPLTPRTFAYMLIGKHSGEQGEFDNQVVSVDLRVRPPLGRIPLVVYIEWGLDDSAGAWMDVPATVVGAELAALPGIPTVTAGIERVRFAGACCGNTIWYRNWSLRGGWSHGGHPTGHPIAGHGREWAGRIGLDALDARLRLEARGFLRERGEENLFAPEREGRSHGGQATLRLRIGERFDLLADGAVERGRGDWRRSSASAALRVRF